jgi:HIV Tat-specific factor 1
VELALKILDGTPLRPGGRPIMSVTRAKFEQKGEVFVKKQQNKQKKKKLKQQEQRALGWGMSDSSPVLDLLQLTSSVHLVHSSTSYVIF